MARTSKFIVFVNTTNGDRKPYPASSKVKAHELAEMSIDLPGVTFVEVVGPEDYRFELRKKDEVASTNTSVEPPTPPDAKAVFRQVTEYRVLDFHAMGQQVQPIGIAFKKTAEVCGMTSARVATTYYQYLRGSKRSAEAIVRNFERANGIPKGLLLDKHVPTAPDPSVDNHSPADPVPAPEPDLATEVKAVVAEKVREKTEWERKREEERAKLKEAVSALLTSEGWQAWIKARQRFRTYSFNNQVLIQLQRPDATRVMGFRAWIDDFNRVVKRGEKAIKIMVPREVTDYHSERDPETGKRTGKRLIFPMQGRVFDAEQTEPIPGAPVIPVEPPVQDIKGDEFAPLLDKLIGYAKDELEYSVAFTTLKGMPKGTGGFCRPGDKVIEVRSTFGANRKVRTLIHEIAHAHGLGYEEDGYSRDESEMMVETITYLVCNTIGLDASGYSLPYLASWSAGDVDKVDKFANTIHTVARQIEKVLGY